MNNDFLVTRRRAIKLGFGMFAGGVGAVTTSKTIVLNHQIQVLDNPNRKFSISGNFSLKERAAAKGLMYGAAIQYSQLSSDKELANIVKHECRVLVPEWELKWHVGKKPLRPSPYNFDFTRADWMANFAKTHGLLLRGHTLVWHESLPPWFKSTVNRQNAKQFLERHIKTVVKRYAGKIHSWDVVNEAIDTSDHRSDGLRTTPWLKLLGPNYIDLAFRLAAESDPQALLVYNDFGLDYDTPQNEAKRTAVLKLLERLKSQGTPIHALGIQAHLSPNRNFNPKKLRQFLRDVASLELKIMITEMDVKDKKLPLDIVVRDRIIAGLYEDYLAAALDEQAVIAVINWGLSDRYTWLSEFQPRRDQAPVRPLPFDTKMQRKLAWNAIARSFDQAPER
ncbi:endo-1,4-beta-xylanase [Halotia branconii]|uniref:Beta-xylanase n=1 Tax=Halotia branconii CENA392 TaxID=1539056 RepID=A0AAJ6PBB9_9CYAN|nr:endo-1,4-beta-xylanase [Halotia branconii]WGV27779.1 endo-1,4-beta-xylanase [Halotia branconii CENA392]